MIGYIKERARSLGLVIVGAKVQRLDSEEQKKTWFYLHTHDLCVISLLRQTGCLGRSDVGKVKKSLALYVKSLYIGLFYCLRHMLAQSHVHVYCISAIAN
jgi:hypothetical protein